MALSICSVNERNAGRKMNSHVEIIKLISKCLNMALIVNYSEITLGTTTDLACGNRHTRTSQRRIAVQYNASTATLEIR